MNVFSGEKLSGKETREERRCIQCDAQPHLIHKMLEPRTEDDTDV
jgi:hypothetical protein